MPLIEIKTQINADRQTCFDLSRDIDFHQESLKHSNEKAIAGKISGRINMGESVTWEARHLGIKQRLTSKITAFETTNYFVDEMVSGAFKSFKHEHIFKENKASENNKKATLMIDRIAYESPLGILGKCVNYIFLNQYLKNLLIKRNQLLKQKAEALCNI